MAACATRSALMIALAVPALTGCIERKETIIIEPDGSVRMKLAFSTNSFDELYLGDAVPTIEGGWVVAESVERDEEGKETFTLEAEAAFGPKDDLPSSYASPRDPDGDTYLQFPTELTFEERRDGIYYHFSRRYVPRPWAFYEQAQEQLRKEMEKLKGKSFEEMSLQEQAQVVRLVARVETAKYESFAREAFKEVLADAPQDAWLHARAALMKVFDELDPVRIVEIMSGEDEERRTQALEEEARAFEEGAMEAMRKALREQAGISAGKINAFTRSFNWQKRYYEITEDLGDDRFQIAVRMPGEIVAHNGDKAVGGEVTWQFEGRLIRDHELELMVTSRLPR